MMKRFDDTGYKVLVFLVILSFGVTMASDLSACYGIRAVLAGLVFVYVSYRAIKDPKCRAAYPMAYLLYFWATAVAFCLVNLLKVMEVRLPAAPLLGVFALFPIVSIAVIWRKREYRIVSPYVFIQITCFVAMLLNYVINR